MMKIMKTKKKMKKMKIKISKNLNQKNGAFNKLLLNSIHYLKIYNLIFYQVEKQVQLIIDYIISKYTNEFIKKLIVIFSLRKRRNNPNLITKVRFRKKKI